MADDKAPVREQVKVSHVECAHTLLSAICQPQTGVTVEQFFEEWKRVGDVPVRLKQKAFEALYGKKTTAPETHAGRDTEW